MPQPAPIPWPDHWYQDDTHIRCVVPDCEFTIDTKLHTKWEHQWRGFWRHSEGTPGAEHILLQSLLRQSICADYGCREPRFRGSPSFQLRRLFNHEETAHGSHTMSEISSFVALAREGRILRGSGGGSNKRVPIPDCGTHIFDRMMKKVRALPEDDLHLLVTKATKELPVGDFRDILAQIVTVDPSKKASEPYWRPLAAEDFLMFCRPLDTDPADEPWRVLWTDLRKKYAEGHI